MNPPSKDESITASVLPPCFTCVSRRRPHRVPSYPDPITGIPRRSLGRFFAGRCRAPRPFSTTHFAPRLHHPRLALPTHRSILSFSLPFLLMMLNYIIAFFRCQARKRAAIPIAAPFYVHLIAVQMGSAPSAALWLTAHHKMPKKRYNDMPLKSPK